MVFVDYYKEKKQDKGLVYIILGILIPIIFASVMIFYHIFATNIIERIKNELKLMEAEKKRLETVTELAEVLKKEIAERQRFLGELDSIVIKRSDVLDKIDNIITLKINGYEIKEIIFKGNYIQIHGISVNNVIPAVFVEKIRNFIQNRVTLDKIKKTDKGYESIISIYLSEEEEP